MVAEWVEINPNTTFISQALKFGQGDCDLNCRLKALARLIKFEQKASAFIHNISFQPCNVTNRSTSKCSLPKFSEKQPTPRRKCDPDLIYHPYQDHRETTIIPVFRSFDNTKDDKYLKNTMVNGNGN